MTAWCSDINQTEFSGASPKFLRVRSIYGQHLYALFMNRENNTYCFFMPNGVMRARTSDRRGRVPGGRLIAAMDVVIELK